MDGLDEKFLHGSPCPRGVYMAHYWELERPCFV